MNKNWPRWIKSSIAQHFRTALSGALVLYLEGEHRNTEGSENYCELRIDGPHDNKLSPSLHKISLVIDVLVVGIQSDKNIYIHDDFIGLLSAAFTGSITIYKYGLGVDDSPDPEHPSELGCLKLLPDVSEEKIIVTRFGQSDPTLKMQRASIEAGYEMLLEV